MKAVTNVIMAFSRDQCEHLDSPWTEGEESKINKAERGENKLAHRVVTKPKQDKDGISAKLQLTLPQAETETIDDLRRNSKKNGGPSSIKLGTLSRALFKIMVLFATSVTLFLFETLMAPPDGNKYCSMPGTFSRVKEMLTCVTSYDYPHGPPPV